MILPGLHHPMMPYHGVKLPGEGAFLFPFYYILNSSTVQSSRSTSSQASSSAAISPRLSSSKLSSTTSSERRLWRLQESVNEMRQSGLNHVDCVPQHQEIIVSGQLVSSV